MEEQADHFNKDNYDYYYRYHMGCFDDHYFDDGFEDFGQNENLHDIIEEPVVAKPGLSS